ncbi:MAG TPA: hypothetical protein VEZ13_20515 [Brevibacillus sp.]|nr:hypothetical protein [Brevibacillus sp.]
MRQRRQYEPEDKAKKQEYLEFGSGGRQITDIDLQTCGTHCPFFE